MNSFRFGLIFLLMLSFLGLVLGACYVNDVEVECPQFLNDYGFLIAIAFVLIILVIIAFVAFTFLKTFLTGSVNVVLPKTVFAPNEKVTGKIGIDLKKVIEVSNAKVTLQGEVTRTQFRNGLSSTKTEVFFQTSENVIAQPNYPLGKSEVDFFITIPTDILSKGKFDASALGQLGNAINFIQSVALPKPRWYLIASITTKENLTLSSKKEIQIN